MENTALVGNALVPPGVVTVIGPDTAVVSAVEGMATVNVLDVTPVIFVKVCPFQLTDVAPSRFVPAMVTTVVGEPTKTVAGDALERLGAPTMVSTSPEFVADMPEVVVTTISPDPASASAPAETVKVTLVVDAVRMSPAALVNVKPFQVIDETLERLVDCDRLRPAASRDYGRND